VDGRNFILTVRIAKLTGGQPLLILIIFCAVTDVTSAFEDENRNL
jgi:hypothetical protein